MFEMRGRDKEKKGQRRTWTPLTIHQGSLVHHVRRGEPLAAPCGAHRFASKRSFCKEEAERAERLFEQGISPVFFFLLEM